MEPNLAWLRTSLEGETLKRTDGPSAAVGTHTYISETYLGQGLRSY
jgi:hypothetical protein